MRKILSAFVFSTLREIDERSLYDQRIQMEWGEENLLKPLKFILLILNWTIF